MKLKKLQQKSLWITTPLGHAVQVSFPEYCYSCYEDSQEFKNRLKFSKYMLIKKEALEEGWNALIEQMDKQTKKNGQIHRRAYLSVKYAIKLGLFRFKRLFTKK